MRAHQTRQFTVESQILCHRPRTTQLPLGMVKKCALPIAEVEAAKACQCLGVSMFDHGVLFPNERVPLHAPAVAKLAVFGSG